MSTTPEENNASEPENLSRKEVDEQIERLQRKREELGEESPSEDKEETPLSTSVDTGKAEESSLSVQEEEPEKSHWVIITVCTIVAIIAGFTGAYFYDDWNRGQSAANELNELAENTGNLLAVNTDVLDYGEEDGSYALGVGNGSNHPDYGTFVFRNDTQEYDRTVDLYIDYSSQRSVDLMLVNNTMLRGLIESGNAEVRLHPVPSDHPLSLYSAETLAQVMHRHPDKVWEVNISLLQLHTELRDRGEGETISTEEILELIENELSYYHDIEDIDADLIREGMFFDWLTATAQSPDLSGGAPPLVYSDGALVESGVYHNSEELRQNILSGPTETQDGSQIDLEEDLQSDDVDIENSADTEQEEQQGE